MRVFLWILLLLALCAAAVLYQDRFTDAARADREQQKGRIEPADDLPPGFGHVVIGAKSGAPIVEAPPEAARPEGPGSDRRDGRGDPGAAAGPARETEHVVERGQSLSTICAAHYGTSRADLVQALARYNRIDRIDSIREGQTIRIPPLEKLGAPKK